MDTRTTSAYQASNSVAKTALANEAVNDKKSGAKEKAKPERTFSYVAFLQNLLANLFAQALGIKERLNRSKIIDNQFAKRADKVLLSFFDLTRLSDLLNGLSRRVHRIVAQRNEALKEGGSLNSGVAAHEASSAPADNRPVSTATRFGFVSLALLALVGTWLWISEPAANATDINGSGMLAGNIGSQGSFAVINPANVDESTLQADAEQLGPDQSNVDQAANSRNNVKPLAVIAAAMTNVPGENSATADALSNSALSGVAQLANAASQQNSSDGASPSDDGPKTIAQLGIDQRATETPTPQPTPTITPTPTEEDIPVDVPQLRLIPMLPFPSALPTETPTATPTITPTPLPIEPGALWSTFIPGPSDGVDHFWLERPFRPSEQNQLASANYQFGSSAFGRYRMHHGLDMSNPLGTPVLATVDGEVIHAGIDDPVLLAPFTNFYGNAVVIRLDRKLEIAGSEIDVFVLFGHLNSVNVSVGQRVSPQDIIGELGMTGIAIGPHLHIEVRVGSNTYDKTVNPYLWMRPQNGRGAVAVRLLTADGRTWPGGRVSLIGQGGVGYSRTIEIYLDDEPLGPDPRFGENGAMGSVPPGNYLLAGTVNGENFRKEIVVKAGETTFAEIRTQQ